jgi:peptidoglycan/xylan/chitin deacetylase (PgdA/CDA1 family)
MIPSRARICILTVLAFSSLAALAAPPDRQIAITIDDLPGSEANRMTAADITDMNSRILTTLRNEKIPAVGFVNEQKLYKFGEVDARIQALAMWLDAGLELGNHTFSHSSLHRVPLAVWEENVVQGETVTRMLLAQHKMQLRYFRHPFLQTGRDLLTRQQADAFLSGRGYRIAPVTIDAWDWMFAGVYADAKRRNDAALMQQTAHDYLSYTDAMFAYDEQRSRDLVGYEIKQIILLHGNELEADHLGDVVQLIKKRGYRFITLDDALSDPAYSLPDTYIGEEGTDWLDHWAITRGKPSQGRPVVPAWLNDRWNALPRVPPTP